MYLLGGEIPSIRGLASPLISPTIGILYSITPIFYTRQLTDFLATKLQADGTTEVKIIL